MVAGNNTTGTLNIAARINESIREVQATISASCCCCAPQARATIAVEATDNPMKIACTRKNTLCPVVTAATALVPNWATIFMCMNPTVVNSRLDIMLGQASFQTLRLADGKALALLVTKAVKGVVIYQAASLHVRIEYGRADKGEAPFFHIFADGVR